MIYAVLFTHIREVVYSRFPLMQACGAICRANGEAALRACPTRCDAAGAARRVRASPRDATGAKSITAPASLFRDHPVP